MKKLLLVLLVITLASFLFVGCLPGTTPAEGEGEGEGEGEVEVAITVEGEYTNASGETYVSCKNTEEESSVITVTFPTPVETDYIVQVAWKMETGAPPPAPEFVYIPNLLDPLSYATPNEDRTVWTLEGFPWSPYLCKPICLVAIVKHPCCPGEEVALKIVTVDCTPPKADLYLTFNDCGDPCEIVDECNLPVPGAYMEWTSRSSTDCDTTDCCDDDCSGLASWSMEVDPDDCEGPCDLVSGTTCPVEGALDCGCLLYPESGTSEVIIIRTLTDNVGNEATEELTIILDTDEVVSVNGIPVDMGVAVPIVDDACLPQPA